MTQHGTERDVIVQLTDLIGGLIPWVSRKPAMSLQANYQGAPEGRIVRALANAGVPTHCLRSVSQRSLSAPVKFLSTNQTIAAGTDIFEALVTNAVTGALPGVGLGGSAPIQFNDANVQAERARLQGLVLIGARAKIACQAQAGVGGPGTPFNYGEFVNSIMDFVRDYVVTRFYWKSDDKDPWVNDTPLRYFDREGNGEDFLPVPPVEWSNRDPFMQMDVRVADFGAAAGALPTLSVSDNAIDAQLSILFETLWIPNPATCGDYWPGGLCPKEHVKGSRHYQGKD